MTDRWQRLQELFEQACELPETEREAFVARIADRDLASELRALLGNADTDAPVVSAIADAVKALSEHPSLIGTRIGAYRLRELLGEGGMGAVYAATRDDGEFARDVAIKVLRPLASADHVARFRDERQILAGLDHPAIVRLLDGGRTDDGLPYLVMERVDGVPITRYLRGRPAREAAELIVRVASAIGYAHGKLVVHRDIKPSNVLVEPTGTPKLLDFGIAKLLEGGREAETRGGTALFTPEYASPEQARGEPITVATDIYSLGAVAYEVLAGKPPQASGANMMETLRSICERDPAPPGASPDLDSVVLKALQKRPADRYGSIAELIADLERFLDGRPVKARAATPAYRAAKFVRRNAGKLALATAIAGGLATAAVISVGQARRANELAAIAIAERERLLFERGWQELAAGHAGAALPLLARAAHDHDGPAVRFLLAEALRPFEHEVAVIPFIGGANGGGWFPDGNHVALYGRGGFAIFDRDGRPVGPASTIGVWAIAIAPDGKTIALAQDHSLLVRDFAGTTLRELPSTGDARLAYATDGTLAVAEVAGRFRMIAPAGAVVLDQTFATPTAVAAGSQVVLGLADGRVVRFDLQGRQRGASIAAHTGGITHIQLAGARIITASLDATAKVWTTDGTPITTFAGHNALVESLTASDDRVATGGRDGSAIVWSIANGFQTRVRGHDFGVTGVDLSPDGTTLLTTGGDGTHRIWELPAGTLALQFESRVGGGTAPSARSGSLQAFYDRRGERILAVAGNSAKLLRVDRGALRAELDTGRGRQPRAAIYGPGERELAMVGPGGQFEIWDAIARKRVVDLAMGDVYLWDVAWSPDGSQLAVAGNVAALVDRATLAVHRLTDPSGPIGHVLFEPGGDRLLAATAAGIRILDARTRTPLGFLPAPRTSSAIWNRAGDRIYTTSADGIGVWDASSFSRIDMVTVATRYLDLALSPDEHSLALAAHDGTIALVDLAPARVRLIATGHTGPVTSVAWSPDGTLLASSADDQTARIWDPLTGKLLATRRHRDGAMSVVWNADGTSITTASTDGSVRIWDAHLETRSLDELDAVIARVVPGLADPRAATP